MPHNRIVLLFAALAAAFALGPGPSLAAPRADEPPPERPIYDIGLLEPLPGSQPAGGGQALAAVNPTSLTPTSRVVYQSFRDNNWEIYITSPDGGSHQRLTYHAEPDVLPSLNRGNTRIAFASYRDGEAEIYVMNVDGSGQTRLTATDGPNTLPAWSPDGSKIAFTAQRDGKAEVYVMNADGSGQTRLTYDGEYNASPAWSPDGTQIAFVSYRNGGYRIWTMNANGSGQAQRSSQPYSNNPVWSPDGTQIAYDADFDGDGWQDLMVMHASGGAQTVVLDHWAESDLWANGWSPDGRYLLFTYIEFIYFQGNWYWVAASVNARDQFTGSIHALADTGLDWNGEWQVSDLTPPAAQLLPLDEYTKAGTLVTWSGGDVGGAGLASYDVQYRALPDQGWVNWLLNTPYASDTFGGTPGSAYAFQVRARDRAGNTEAWAPYAEAQSTFYTWAIHGRVGDNGGAPVAGATFAITPAAFAGTTSQPDGQYAGYVDGAGPAYTVQWSKAAYGTLPATTYLGPDDIHTDFILPPPDNVVQNWGFESGGSEATGWTLSGSLSATTTSEALHTGTAGLRLGSAGQVAEAQNVVEGCVDDSQTFIFAGPDGSAHAVWSKDQDGLYARLPMAGAWAAPGSPSIDFTQIAGLGGAVDANGTFHVAWASGYWGKYFQHVPGVGWTNGYGLIFGPINQAETVSLVLAPNGVVHVFMVSHRDELVHIYRTTGGAWLGGDILDVGGAYSGSWPFPMSAAVDAHGTVFVAWPEDGQIFVRRLPAGSVWGGAQNVSQGAGFSNYPVIQLDPAGRAHVVWQNLNNGTAALYYTTQSGGGWLAAQRITEPAGDLVDFGFAADGAGRLHVAWAASGSNLYYRQRSASGQWMAPLPTPVSAPAITGMSLALDAGDRLHITWWHDAMLGYFLAPDLNRPSHWLGWTVTDDLNQPAQALAVDGVGRAHFLWRGDDCLLHHTTSPVEAQTGSVSAAQVVNLAGLQSPSLSFMYQLLGAPGGANFLTAWIDDGVEATPVFTATSPAALWTHATADLSAWAGETVTLSVSLNVSGGTSSTWANLDEVTVGSTFPDAGITAGGAASAMPGDSVVFDLVYENQGGAASHTPTLTLTLPADLTFVSASAPPASTNPLIWNLGTLPAHSGPATIVVTATVAPTATRGVELPLLAQIAGTPELETLNNTFQFMLWIGQRLFLPVTHR